MTVSPVGTRDAGSDAGAEIKRSTMRVRKRSGEFEPVDVDKIVRAVRRCATGLSTVDPLRVATRTISGLYDGATTVELDRLSIQTAAELVAEEPEYSKLAARLLATFIDKEVRGQGSHSFSQSIALGHEQGLIGDETAAFVATHARKLDDAVDHDARPAVRVLRAAHRLRPLPAAPPATAAPSLERPQYWLLRVACGLSHTPAEAIRFYRLMSSLAYLPSSPTLFNSGTRHTQMSSCYLLDSPRDELESIYERYGQVARLSKFAGGIGVQWSRVRSRGALIRGTNGHSNGIVPWLRTLDASVAAVNQGGRRKGAACVYLETWHPDIEEFLELRDNTGEDARRTHNLNIANWIPDEFMRRVEADADWSLFDPDEVPELPDLWGEAFDDAYRAAEQAGRAVRTVKARDLYAKMMRTLAQTGNGWMTFKDTANRTCNQTAEPGNVVHLSNLCTEILEVTSDEETAVCNLGLGQPRRARRRRRASTGTRLRATVRTAVTFLDRVIDINYYPTEQAGRSNPRWRPVGLGVMGLQDVFFKLRLPFDSARGEGAVHPARRGDLPDRAGDLRRPGRRRGRAPRVRRDPCRARAAAARPVGRHADADRAVGDAAGAGRRVRAAQLAADRDRADRDHRLDRRLLRVHRAAGVQRVQARDAVRRVPAGQRLPGGGAEGSTACGPRPSATSIKRADGSVQGIDRTARRRRASCSAPRGSCRSRR